MIRTSRKIFFTSLAFGTSISRNGFLVQSFARSGSSQLHVQRSPVQPLD